MLQQGPAQAFRLRVGIGLLHVAELWNSVAFLAYESLQSSKHPVGEQVRP
jgi:hypothetical protein